MFRKFLYRTPQGSPLRSFYLPDLLEDGWYDGIGPESSQQAADEGEWTEKKVELDKYLQNLQIQHRLSRLERGHAANGGRLRRLSGN
jgi:hypothetical protein